MTNINFTSNQIDLMDREQSKSFYWNLKKKCIKYLIDNYHEDNGSILDIGCGTGYVVSDSNFDHNKYLGLDAFSEAEFYLKKNLSDFVGFTSLPIDSLKDNKFDTILLLDVLEHINDDNLFISNITKLMHSKSILIISVPAHQWLYSNADRISGHVKRYGMKDLTKIILNNNLYVNFSSSFLVLTLPLMTISRLFNIFKSDPKNEHSGIVNNLLFKLNCFDFFIFKYLKIKLGGTIVMVVSNNKYL